MTHKQIHNFFRAMLARYILCDSPVLVRLSVQLRAEGPRDAVVQRGPPRHDVIGPSTRPIATDTQQWRGRSIHAAYCYRRAAVAFTRSLPIAIGAVVEQPGGQRTGSAWLF